VLAFGSGVPVKSAPVLRLGRSWRDRPLRQAALLQDRKEGDKNGRSANQQPADGVDHRRAQHRIKDGDSDKAPIKQDSRSHEPGEWARRREKEHWNVSQEHEAQPEDPKARDGGVVDDDVCRSEAGDCA